ncbi:MAG: cupin domain-containing protein [Pseudonocardiaceae bacterium]
MTYAPGLIVLKPGQGRHIAAMGNIHLNKAEGVDTDGAWALVEQEVLGANPPLHLHEREDEAFFVLQGRVRVWVGDAEFEGGAGTFVLAPRGVPHTYARQPGENLKLLVFVSPAGFERMFDDIALLSETEQSDPVALSEIAARYGVQILGPPPR